MSERATWRRSARSLQSSLVATALIASSLTGCVTRATIDAPPCPSPSVAAADELDAVYASDLEADNLHSWLAAISRYCDAVEGAQ